MEFKEGTCVNCGEETLVSVEFEFCKPCTAQDADDAFPYDLQYGPESLEVGYILE